MCLVRVHQPSQVNRFRQYTLYTPKMLFRDTFFSSSPLNSFFDWRSYAVFCSLCHTIININKSMPATKDVNNPSGSYRVFEL